MIVMIFGSSAESVGGSDLLCTPEPTHLADFCGSNNPVTELRCPHLAGVLAFFLSLTAIFAATDAIPHPQILRRSQR